MIESKQTEFHPKNGLHGIQPNPRMWHADNCVHLHKKKNKKELSRNIVCTPIFIFIHLRFLWSSLLIFNLISMRQAFFPHHFGKSCISFWIMTGH